MNCDNLDSVDSIQSNLDPMEKVTEEISLFKSCKETQDKTDHFSKFLIAFDYLLVSSEPSKLKKETIYEFYNAIFENIDLALISITSAIETASIISSMDKNFSPNYSSYFSQAGNSNIKVGTYSIKMILQICCNNYDDDSELYKKFTPFLSSLFSKEDFFTKLAKSNIYEFILSNIIFVTPKHNYDVFIFDTCFVYPKPSYFLSIPISSFTTFFVNSINTDSITENSREITAKFVATLVSKVANVSKGALNLFDQLGGFLAYDKLISKFPEKERPSYYSIFMVSNCEPALIDHLLTLYQQNAADEQTYFEMVSQNLRSQPELIQKCQIEKWFEMQKPNLNHLIAFFKFINQNNQQLSASSLPYLIKSLLKISINFNTADELMKITQKLLNQNFLDLEQLNQMNFLDVFFFNTTQQAFLELINNQSYLQTYISIYFHSHENKQKLFFSKFCEFVAQIEKEKFISICSKLISRCPSIDNMRTLLNTIDQRKDCSYISILLNSFIESDLSINNNSNNNDIISEVYIESSSESSTESDADIPSNFISDCIKCQRNFILAGGVDWIFESEILDIKSIVLLISHLVSSQSYEQLEEKILTLDAEKHPLFSVDQESMLSMVYGLICPIKKIDLYYLPIRIRSLFDYLKNKSNILNPYNIFYLGQEYINSNLKGNDIYSVPYIQSFGNRCISQKHVHLLFERPEKLIEFCDKSYNHFPFYMIFCESHPLMFNVSLSSSSALSFWLKVEQKEEEESKTTLLFQSDNGIKIFSLHNKLHISIETMKYNEIVSDPIETEFDSSEWNHIFITISSVYSFGSNFSITINSTVVSTKVKRKLNQISNILFVNQTQNTILYVSSSIRIFNNYQKNTGLISDIYSKGPSSFTFIENSSIISPSIRMTNSNSNKNNSGLNSNDLTIKKKPILKKETNVKSNEKVFNYGIQSDIYLIPYLGFPKHPISHDLIFEKIKECDSFELYEKLVNTFLAMIDLNPTMICDNDLLDLMKNSKHKPTFDLFILIFQKQINLFGSTKELLTEIIFDTKLWSIFEADFIFKALFQLFPINIWGTERMFATFITHTILTNSDKPEVAQIVVSHLVELPSLMKYVVSLIKVAPVLSRLNPVWNQIEFRENSITQEILINSLIPAINKDNYNFFKLYLPFNEIKSLFIVSSESLCASIFALITQLSVVRLSINKENDYLEFDFVFLSKLIQLSHIKRVWNSALEMNHLPSLLSLILSGTIAFTYFYSNIDACDRYQVSSTQDSSTQDTNQKIEKLIKGDIKSLMNKAISSCVESSTKIMSDPICLKIISVFMPYIFTYPSLFNNFQNINDVSQTEPIVLNVNQFSDIDDDLWIEKLYVLSRFNFPPSSNPLSHFSFVNQIVSSILRNFGFPLPFSFKSYENPMQSLMSLNSLNSMNNINIDNDDLLDLPSWFTQSTLVDLIISIISHCSVQFLDSFLYSIVSSDHYNSLLSTFVHCLLNSIPTDLIAFEKCVIILDCVSVLSSFQLLNQNAILLMSDLFIVFSRVKQKFNDKEASEIASRIQPVLISLFNSVPFSDIKMVFNLLTSNLNAFKFFIESTHSLHSWLYSFIAFSHNEIEVYNEFINKVKSITQFNDYDLSIMEKISKRTIQKYVDDLKEIESEWKELTNNFRLFTQSQFHKIQDEKNRISKEFNQISYDYNYFRYYTNVKHFLLSFFVCQNIRYFEVSSSLYREHFEWRHMMRKIRNDLFQFKPKYRLKYNLCWPYQERLSDSSIIMIPSVFNDLVVEQKKVQTIKSEVIKTFKKVIKFQYVFINDIPLNLFNLFKEKYGNPDTFCNCKMHIDKYQVPCVLMIYEKKILVLTYANIQTLPSKTMLTGSSLSAPLTSFSISGENNFVFQKENDTTELNYFYQNVFCGNIGPVDLFASHILMTIKLDSLISIQWIDKLRFKLWSIIDGFYEFELSQKVNIKYRDTFAFNTAPSKEEVFQQWVCRQLSTNDMFDQLNQMSGSKEKPFHMDINGCGENEVNYNLIKEKLIPYFTDNYFQKNNTVKRNKESPLFYAPFSTLIDYIPHSSLTRLYSPYLQSIYFRGQNIISISTKKICCSCLFFNVQIDVIKSVLSIKGQKTENAQSSTKSSKLNVSTVYVKKYKSKFKFATHVSVSSNGVFISIDYSFGMTEIYRVKCKKKSSYSSLSASQKASLMQSYCETSTPFQIEKVVHFFNESLFDKNIENADSISNSCFSPNYSLISDHDMICILFNGRKIIMLNLVNGFAINQIMMPSEITAVAVDEYNSSIIVAMKQNGIQVISNSFLSQNDCTVEEHPISFSLFNRDVVTAICVVQNRNKEVMRTVVCGTESGKVLMVYYDDKGVDIRPLNSKHTKKIEKIEIDPENRNFISLDADGIAYVWSKLKNDHFIIEFDH